MRRTRRWWLIWSTRIDVFKMRHLSRKSQLQRDWESGDPVRMARVQAVADRILNEMIRTVKEEEDGRGA